MFCRILVIADGSPASERALAEAIELAVSNRARLTILTAVPKPAGWICTPANACASAQVALDFERDCKAILERAVDAVPADVSVTKILTHRPLGKAMLSEVRTGNYDLLVVGGGGHGVLASSLLGTVSQRVLTRCDIPVLLVRDGKQAATAPAQPDVAPSGATPRGRVAVSHS